MSETTPTPDEAQTSDSAPTETAPKETSTKKEAATKEASAKKDAPAKKGFFTRHDPLTQLVLTMPVFLIYHLGILLMDIRNGVDFATNLFLRLLNASTFGYIVVTLVFAFGLVFVAARLRKGRRVRFRALIPLIIESTILAFGMLLCVGWVVQQVTMSAAPSTLQSGLPPMNLFEKIVMSSGAGFHEELVFRVVVFGGLIVVARLITDKAWQKLAFAAVVSSVLFAGVHYVGSLSDSFTFVSFFFRFLSGVYLAAVYRIRGFAYAVYTHTIYDVLVMVFLA